MADRPLKQHVPVPPGLKDWPAPYSDGVASPWVAQLLMGLPMAMALISRDGAIVVGNEALRATVGPGYRPGTRPEWLVIADDADAVAEAVRAAVKGGNRVEVRAALQDRPEEKQVISIIPVPPGMGISALLALRDIREQLRLEAQVAAATRMQAVGQLAGGIAHDFNNILTAILGVTEQLVDRHPGGDPDHDDLIEIRRNGERAAALVEQLLAFARQQPRRQEVLDLAPLLEALRPLLVQLAGKGIELEISGAPLAAAVLADPGQIEQVIVNLAVNARDAMAGQGRLRIRLRHVRAADIAALGHRIMPAADHVAIEVIDTGTGIAPAIAGKIFEPFFTTKPMGQGTGLGLSTVYGIIKQSGGYIFAEPSPDGPGTRFSIFLPAVPLPATAAPQPVVAVPESEASIAGLRLLLVEDEPAVRTILKRGLLRFGPVIVTAADGTEALARLAEGPAFDVLISDIMMPGIDGVKLAAMARKRAPEIGVVLMSGFAEAPLHRAVDAQDVGFVSKPFAIAEMVAAIATANRDRKRLSA
jgi:signal transduction histidine kinase/ActR/RegA family two-component response regulator